MLKRLLPSFLTLPAPQNSFSREMHTHSFPEAWACTEASVLWEAAHWSRFCHQLKICHLNSGLFPACRRDQGWFIWAACPCVRQRCCNCYKHCLLSLPSRGCCCWGELLAFVKSHLRDLTLKENSLLRLIFLSHVFLLTAFNAADLRALPLPLPKLSSCWEPLITPHIYTTQHSNCPVVVFFFLQGAKVQISHEKKTFFVSLAMKGQNIWMLQNLKSP